MSKMHNFYELFNVSTSASAKEIIIAYENKITKYNNLMELSKDDIYQIKLLKIGLYVLTKPELRHRYNLNIGIEAKKEVNNCEPSAGNDVNDFSLDSLFKVDNSWMNKINSSQHESQSSRKVRFETNIGDRVFSLSDMNKRPGFSHEFEASLRKPQQGREDRSNDLISKK